jgi:CheY-like chemotaxis protein
MRCPCVQLWNIRGITLVHFSGKQGFVCEGNQLIAAGWAMILMDAGYKVVGPVPSAEKALEAAYAHAPDLVPIDISLNGMIDGISVAAELAPLGIPVVFATDSYQRGAAGIRGGHTDQAGEASHSGQCRRIGS